MVFRYRTMEKCCLEPWFKCSNYHCIEKTSQTSPSQIIRGESDQHSVLRGWSCILFVVFSGSLKDFACNMSSPSTVLHYCAASQCPGRTAETQVITLCSFTLPGNGKNWRNLIKSLEFLVKINKSSSQLCYAVYLFFRSLPDFKTRDHLDAAAEKIQKLQWM